MGVFDFIKGELLEIIEFNDESRDTLAYRWPDNDREIKRGAQLIVRESQVAQFMYLGQFGDTFGPGKHTLNTDNIPVLSTLEGWKYGFESPFKADVYYVTTRVFAGNRWGTSNPIMVRDKDLGVVRLRAFGNFDFKIVEPKHFIKEVAGTDNHLTLGEFSDVMRARIVSAFSEAVAQSQIPALDLAARYSEVGGAILPLINQGMRDRYGIEFTSFLIENISVPPEVEKALDGRSSMAALGNLNDYVKFQMAQGLGQGGSGGVAGSAAEVAMGFAMAQQMVNQPGGILGQQQASGGAPAAGFDLLSPQDAATLLGVSEGDVLAAINEGALKAKKIGSAVRLTRADLEAFMKG